MRLIDADALDAEMYHKSFEVDDGRNVWNSGLWIRYKIFEEAIRDAPTVDAVPLERDIPKVPTDKQLEEDGYGAWGSLYGRCPNCKGTVYDEQNYCEKCGQRLDWGNGGKEIDAMSTIDALPVKHGKWITEEGLPGVAVCSICGHEIRGIGCQYTKYCDECGARMDKDAVD